MTDTGIAGSDTTDTKFVNSESVVGLKDDRLINIKTVAHILGVCPRTVNRMVAAGELPPPVRVRTASRWYMSEIVSLLAKLKQCREKSLFQSGHTGGTV